MNRLFPPRERLVSYLVALVLCSLLLHSDAEAQSKKFSVNLVGGSVVVVDAEDQVINWKSINDSGEMKPVEIQLHEISKIILTDRPASIQIQRVRQLLDQLGAEDYHARESAQQELVEDQFGVQFLDLIKSELESEDLEVRVRVGQVLDRLAKAKKVEAPEFDFIRLDDGSVLKGDIGEFTLQCIYRDKPLALKRENLRRIQSDLSSVAEFTAGKLKVTLHHKFDESDFAESKRYVDFENDIQGDELEGSANVGMASVNRGIIFEAEEKGYIGISGYPFAQPEMPIGGNSACVIDTSGAYKKRFLGVLRVSFCVPGLPDVSAGVNKFGLFVSRVDAARDFILEAYNSNSQLLGCVESTDESCVFLGIESNEPIAFVRVLSNPYLFQLSRNVDENYAFDSVWFGEPVALHDPNLSQTASGVSSVSLANGDILSVEDVRFGGDVIKVFDPQLKRQLEFARDELRVVRFGNVENGFKLTKNTKTRLRLPDPKADDWMVMLSDRSVLKVEPGKEFRSTLFQDTLDANQIAALWSARDHLRMPVDGDFDQGSHVVVFPTCRIATDVSVSDAGVKWKKGDKIEQPVFTKELRPGKVREDATPDFNEFVFGDRKESQMPTIWFFEPNLTQPENGSIQLIDGQQLTLGESSFSIKSIDDRFVVVTNQNGDLSVELPRAQVQSIRFPK